VKRESKIALLGLALWALPVGAAPDWEKLRLDVEPGVGTSGLKLNEIVPKEWPKPLGPPTLDYRFHDTGEGFRRLFWGKTEAGQLSKGIEVRTIGLGETATIVDILVRGVRATVAKEELFLGLPVNRLTKRSKMIQKDGTTTYVLPGLILEAQDGKLSGLQVSSPASTRWRFSKWTVRAGREVGPIKIGKPLDESLWQAIGEPHQRSKTKAQWSSPDGAQRLEIELDERSGAVKRIRGVGLPWRTDMGVTIGDSTATYQDKHREAKSDMGREYHETVVKMPGLRAMFIKSKLESFDVYPIPPQDDGY
jgi:hypothetical protein